MPLVEVGQLYKPNRTSWPEAAEYSPRGRHHELLLVRNTPTSREVEALSTGLVDLQVYASHPLLLLLYRTEYTADWRAVPFSWHRYMSGAGALRPTLPPSTFAQGRFDPDLPPLLTLGERPYLTLHLVDAATGVLRALRPLALEFFTALRLHEAVRLQARCSNEGMFEETLLGITSRYKAAELVQLAAQQDCASIASLVANGVRLN